jgi:hypothetical protein
MDGLVAGLDRKTVHHAFCHPNHASLTDSNGGFCRPPTQALIKEHHTIEAILENLDAKTKANVPPDWPFAQARELFVRCPGFNSSFVLKEGCSSDRTRSLRLEANKLATLQRTSRCLPFLITSAFYGVAMLKVLVSLWLGV